MKDEDFSINAFNRLISGSGRINADVFTQKIERELKLKTDDNYKIFLDSISLPNGDVSYTKFEEGFVKEEKVQRALEVHTMHFISLFGDSLMINLNRI